MSDKKIHAKHWEEVDSDAVKAKRNKLARTHKNHEEDVILEDIDDIDDPELASEILFFLRSSIF